MPKCISLNNQTCMTRPTLIGLHPDEYNQELCYCSVMVNLNRCNGSCNILDDPFDRICIPEKSNLVVKTVTQIENRITINVNVSSKIRENIKRVKNVVFEILVLVLVKMVNIWDLPLLIQ